MSGVSRFTPKEKAEFVLLALKAPDKISELCREKGMAPVTYNKWKRKYITGGLDAMKGNIKVDSLARGIEAEERGACASSRVSIHRHS
jgi:transposase-like protein